MGKFNIVIVGSVDHGKSTLTGRILYDTKALPQGRMEEIVATCKGLGREFEFAYILDAFLEEREGALTIDTTQVTFRTAKREYVIIDTPGHKEFLKNMVTGTSYAEAAMLIVSVQDGIEEQTRRHAYILKLFGIKQIIVVVNKMDAAGYSREKFERIRGQLEELFNSFGMRMLYTIPVCARNGDNIVLLSAHTPWYKNKTLLEALDCCKKEANPNDFRMPVQDIYRLDDKDVIVGRISSGQLSLNETVVILPSHQEAGVSAIQVFEGKKEKALAGENVGVILDNGAGIKRGDVLSNISLPKTGKVFLALLLCLKDTLHINTQYILQCATQKVNCRIESVEEQISIQTLQSVSGDFLSEADIGRVRIAADAPLVYEKFDTLCELGRFVLREGADIIAAGIIV
jgi:sulfate adenylyltransferase subunit 1 (EFTu-like GTPase family)